MKPTREQIENGTNEELRLLVAEYVMGWEDVQSSRTKQVLEDGRVLSRGSGVFGIPPSHTDAPDREINPYFKGVPNYPVRIAAAWLVHKSMWKKPSHRRRLYLDKITEVVGVRLHGDSRWTVGWPDAFMNVEPEDICRAALLAVLEEEE